MSSNHEVVWERFHFGKLVQSPGGPIVKGLDHAHTGSSAGFPSALHTLCRPDVLGLGAPSEHAPAHKYPWADTGGLVSGVTSDPEPWIVIARIQLRREDGEGSTTGRVYTEAQYVATRASGFHASVIPGLVAKLRAEPQLAKSLELPPHRTHVELDAPLPAGWLAEVEQPLRSVLSGVAYGLQDWKGDIAAFAERAALCLAALPHTLMWRVGFGAGLMSMTERTAMALSMVASGVRVVQGTPRNEKDFDLRPGEAYVTWLGQHAGGCRTYRELQDVLATEFPELTALDAIPTDVAWAEAARMFTSKLEERRGVRAFLENLAAGTVPNVLPSVAHSRDRILEPLLARVTTHYDPRLLELLADTRSWTREWDAVRERAPAAVALGPLLGVRPLEHASDIAHVANLEIPPRLAKELAAQLSDLLARASSLGDWYWFAEGAVAPWLREWLRGAAPALAWLGLRGALSSQDKRALLESLEGAAPEAARSLLSGRPPDERGLEALARGSSSKDVQTLEHLASTQLEHSPWGVLRLLELAEGVGTRTDVLSDLRAAPRSQDEQAAARLVEELGTRRPSVTPLIVIFILNHWSSLEQRVMNTPWLPRELGRHLSTPFAEVILDTAGTSTPGPADEAAQTLLLESPNRMLYGESLIEALSRARSADIEQRTLEALRSLWTATRRSLPRAEAPRFSALLEFLEEPAARERNGQGTSEQLTALTEPDLKILIRVLRGLGVDQLIPRASTELRLAVLLAAWQKEEPPLLRPQQFGILLDAVLKDAVVRAQWQRFIEERKWSKRPGWQHVALKAEGASYASFVRGLALDQASALFAATLGLPLTRHQLAVISRGGLEECLRRSPEDCLSQATQIVEVVQKAAFPELATAVAEWALGRLHKPPLEIVRELEKKSVFDRVKLTKPKPTEISVLKLALEHLTEADRRAFVHQCTNAPLRGR